MAGWTISQQNQSAAETSLDRIHSSTAQSYFGFQRFREFESCCVPSPRPVSPPVSNPLPPPNFGICRRHLHLAFQLTSFTILVRWPAIDRWVVDQREVDDNAKAD